MRKYGNFFVGSHQKLLLFPAGIIGNSIGLRGDGFLEFETPAPKFMTVLFSTEEENSMLLIQGNERNFWMVSSKF